MADQLSVEDWKRFLKARIQQERGDDAGALETFDALLAHYPTNKHLLASRMYAHMRLGHTEPALAARIDAEYTEAGRNLVGSRDQPDVWIERLTALATSLEDAKPMMGLEGSVAVAW